MEKIRIITHRYAYMGLECDTVVEIEDRYGDTVTFKHNGKTWALKAHQGDFEFMCGDEIVNDPTFDSSLEKRKNGKIKAELLETGFPNAMMALAEVMTWAADYKGYLPNDWKDIPDAKNSLLAAAARHRLKRLKGEEFDDESKLPHLYHEAFNVMAQLELLITGKLE